MVRRLLPLILILAAGGCDTLFPELYPPMKMLDGGDGDGGAAMPHISGSICRLTDLRDFRSCSPLASGSFRVTDEEDRATTGADRTGQFVLPTATSLAIATLGAVDATQQFAPTITVVHPVAGVLEHFALPALDANDKANLSLVNGFPNDPTRGAVLAWAVDAQGTPIAGVRANAINNTAGPFYDGPTAGSVQQGQGTGAHGLVATLEVPAGTLMLTLTPPPGATVKGDTFLLPVRAGAVTMMALTLPAAAH